MVDQCKIAQIAGYFLSKSGGTLNVLKLTKLLYLAERASLAGRGMPMSGDAPVSMPQGPVLSRTLDLTNGAGPDVEGGWKDWVEDRAHHNVRLRESKNNLPREAYDYLSDSDLALLDDVWEQFGHMGRFEIRDWTHDNCSEWQDPNGSSLSIPLENIFRAVGYPKKDSSAMARQLKAERELDALLES